jgi:SAM-dependent methyltransferase
MKLPLNPIQSYRRNFLDKELELTAPHYFMGTILDIGGASHRGQFKHDPFNNVIIIDNNKISKPTIIADMHFLPIKTGIIGNIKITEVLEYSQSPDLVFSEMLRVLRPFGNVILSVPFNMGIHYDNDNIRLTKHMLKYLFKKHKFMVLRFTQNGFFFTVISYMLKQAIMSYQTRLRWILYPVFPLLDLLTILDQLPVVKNSKFFSSFTLGYFTVLMKWEAK